MMINEATVLREEAIALVFKHGGVGYTREAFEKAFDKFLENRTAVIVRSKRSGIVAVCLFNLVNDTFKVEECVIHPDFRSVRTLKYIALSALKRFPFVKNFSFHRERKYEGREPRVCSLQKLFGGK